MIVKTVFIVKKVQLPIEENVNIVRWIVKIYKVNHHNIEKKTNETTVPKLTISAIRWKNRNACGRPYKMENCTLIMASQLYRKVKMQRTEQRAKGVLKMASLNTIGGIHYEIMKRCYDPNSVAYKDYGAKGIIVCEEWHDRNIFRQWCLDNCYKKGMRLERINSKGNYEPSNCIFGVKYKKDANSNRQNIKSKSYIRNSLMEEFGVPKNYSKSRLYKIFKSMHVRCENPNHEHFNSYGGRGISVCGEWSGKFGFFKFYKWSIENGYSETLTIDRINNDNGYCPENCRWVDMDVQVNNKRNRIYVEYNGAKILLSDLAKLENIKYQLLYSRYKNGLDIKLAIQEIKDSYK